MPFMPTCRRLLLACTATFGLLAPTAQAQVYESGKSYFDDQHYIEFIPGDMPLVISAPHGGMSRPAGIPDRDAGNAGCPAGKHIVVAIDTDSGELARDIQRRFFETHGVRPYVIIAHISRRKVDLNRDLDEAACGNADMQQTWKQWHAFLHSAVMAASARFGGALYIDLHGHGHTRQRLELGYALGANQLAAMYGKTTTVGGMKRSGAGDEEDDASISTAGEANRHSLANLPALAGGRITLRELLFGDDAFGTLAATAGIDAVPSRQDPYPQAGEAFFNGGYNARRYTGADYPLVFGWQIETHRNARRAGSRGDSARALTNALIMFMERNTELKLPAKK